MYNDVIGAQSIDKDDPNTNKRQGKTFQLPSFEPTVFLNPICKWLGSHVQDEVQQSTTKEALGLNFYTYKEEHFL